jgi:hypothetical protein
VLLGWITSVDRVRSIRFSLDVVRAMQCSNGGARGWDKGKDRNMSFPFIGSVSTGTTLREDLIPSFLYVLSQLDPAQAREVEAEMPKDDPFPDGWYESEDGDEVLNDLFERLNALCPEGLFFGSNEDDAADYGFWPYSEFLESPEDFDALKVNDLSKIPEDHTGTVVEVNDHGNVTVYSCVKGRLEELWSVV